MSRILFILFCVFSFSALHAFEFKEDYECEIEKVEANEEEINDEEIASKSPFKHSSEKKNDANEVDSNNAMATLEAGPSAIVAGCVNAITGDFFESHVSLIVPGAQPLVVQCSYCSSEKEWDFRHMSSLDVENSNGKLYARYLDDNGSGITYKAYFGKTKIQGNLYVPTKLFEKGLTNCGSGIINGKTNWRNSCISMIEKQDNKSYLLTRGSGVNRIFVQKESTGGQSTAKEYKKSPLGQFKLESESHSSGNRLLYRYEKDKLVRVKAVNLANQTLAYLSVTRDRHSKKMNWISDSGYVAFKFYDNKEKRIHQIIPSHAPWVSYEYNKNKSLKKKILPERRFLKIEYYDSGKEKGRVSHLITPSGITHSFQYFMKGETLVYDAERNITKYCYDKKTKRLQSVKRFNQSKKLLTKDNYFWSNHKKTNGNLIAKTFEGDGKIHFSRILDYDNFDNVILDRLYGNLTGKSLQPLMLQNEYIPVTPCDASIKAYHYSQDGKNLLLVENDGKNLIFYDYHPNQLLKTRLTTHPDGKILKREFYEYDINGTLIAAIWDDGQSILKDDLSYVTERHAKLITPSAIHPIGLPQIVEEYYLDMLCNQPRLLNKIVYTHSPQGKVLQEDHYGSDGNFAYSLKWEYDYLGNITKKIDAMGHVTTYCYDGNGNKIYEEGPYQGWHKEFFYDFCNNLREEKEFWPDGTTLITYHEYNKLNQRISTTNPQGHKTTFTYDTLGRIIKTEGPSFFIGPGATFNPVEETQYDAMGNAIVQKDANGYITKSAYTIRGQPYCIEYPDGSLEHKEYSIHGLLVKEIARNGLITEYTYDSFDRILTTTLSDSQGNILKTKSSSYSAFNQLSETDEEGVVTTYEYDGAGRLVAKRKGSHSTQYQYDSLGRTIKTIDNVNGTSRVTCKIYDYLNRVIEERIEDEREQVFNKEQYSYDSSGNRTAVIIFTETGKATTETTYTPDGKPLLITDAQGNQTRYTYEHSFFYKGQNVFAFTKTDPLGYRETIVHDTQGNVCWKAKADAIGKTLQQEISYFDALGHITLSQIIVYHGEEQKRIIETTWEYNSMGNLIRSVEAENTSKRKVISHQYNSYGQKDKTTMPNGISIIYEYDCLGRLSSYQSTDNTIHYQYTYDKKDRPILIKDFIHKTTTERIYDSNDCLLAEKLDNGISLTYIYDQLDRLLSVTLPDQSAIRYRYNAHRLLSIERIKEDKIAYTHHYTHYDLADNLIEESLLGQAGSIYYQYDLLQRPVSVKAPHWQESIPKEGFDAIGNLLKRKVKDKQGKLANTYTYDGLNQLISENGFVSHTYQNDSVYNRIAKNDQPHEVNVLNQLKSQNNFIYHYDDNGNLIEKRTESNKINYVYDALDRLIEVNNGDEVTTYTYDFFHRRLSKTHNDVITHYIYHNQNEIGAIVNGKITELRVLGLSQGAEIGGAVALELQDKIYAPIHDPQGNIVALVDPTGELIQSYRYTAFGEMQIFSNTIVDNPWRYSSKRFDSETGFIYFGRRYYDPSIGRWITPDPAGYADGPNLYAYVHNKPLIYIDPDGRFAYAAYQAVVSSMTSFNAGLNFGNSIGSLSHSSGSFEAIQTTAKEDGNPFFFSAGAMLSATTSPINNAIEATLNFLHKDFPGLTLGSIPYGPGGGATCVIKGFLQEPKNYETFLTLIQRMQRTQIVAFNHLKIPQSSEIPILFGQKSVGQNFSEAGYFKSKSIIEVTQELNNGTISPHQLPINVIARGGYRIALNNRSLITLNKAGKKPTILIDRTRKQFYQGVLNNHLRGTEPTDVITIRGIPPETFKMN
jgi:RHS repeat-associated protein